MSALSSNFTKALEVARASGNRTGEGLTLNALGSAYLVLSQPRKAIDYFEQALAIAREVKNRRQECMALATLGFARQQLGEYAKSIEQLNQARSMLAELKTRVSGTQHVSGFRYGSQCHESTRQGYSSILNRRWLLRGN